MKMNCEYSTLRSLTLQAQNEKNQNDVKRNYDDK